MGGRPRLVHNRSVVSKMKPAQQRRLDFFVLVMLKYLNIPDPSSSTSVPVSQSKDLINVSKYTSRSVNTVSKFVNHASTFREICQR